MAETLLEEFVAGIRAAASSNAPSDALRTLLENSFSRSREIADAIAALDEDEVLLFEDSTCSVWTCRYNPDVVFAPHEHCMPVHIAVYRGAEVEVLYKREQSALRHGGNLEVRAGEVITLGPEAIHAVTAEGESQSHAIHIYEGPLTKVKRALFNWTSGAAVDFTMENFHAMKRQKSDMAEF